MNEVYYADAIFSVIAAGIVGICVAVTYLLRNAPRLFNKIKDKILNIAFGFDP